ncbi:APC family permease [Actinomyces vulturis]|uniref:APC family permease n=1 Tax=Actinomyces vulturis TaxID=1857645 RepID=UPI000831093A|nr:APC family permease [Actinomyces vulturis]
MATKKISLLDAISIGIGGMVGGGIFAVLGLAVSLAKGATPVAFACAGVVALITAASYSKLSQKYSDRGGTVCFINKAFGAGIFSGSLNNLLWISYVIMLSLYASAFGSYAPNLWNITGSRSVDYHIYATAIILIATAINYYSIAVVGRIESVAVVIKLVILLAFIGIGAYGLIGNPMVHQLSVTHWESPIHLFAGGMVIFVAYEGFELIANAAPDIKDPEKNIARAFYASVIFVIILYIVIAIVTVGSLSFADIGKAQDYVLAQAAKPMLGQVGFTIITIAALISTFSAINASIYGGGQVSDEIARDGEFFHSFTDQFIHQPVGLAVTSVLTLISVNVLPLQTISTAGSLGFLLIFAVVNASAVKLSANIGMHRAIPTVGAVLCLVASVILVGQQWRSTPTGVTIAVGLVAVCVGVEALYKRTTRHQVHTNSAQSSLKH